MSLRVLWKWWNKTHHCSYTVTFLSTVCATKQPTKTASEPVLTWKEGVSISVDHHTLDWRQVISDPSGCHDPKLATLTHTCKINKNWEQVGFLTCAIKILPKCVNNTCTNPKLIHTLNAQKPHKLIHSQLREAFTCLCTSTHSQEYLQRKLM